MFYKYQGQITQWKAKKLSQIKEEREETWKLMQHSVI